MTCAYRERYDMYTAFPARRASECGALAPDRYRDDRGRCALRRCDANGRTGPDDLQHPHRWGHADEQYRGLLPPFWHNYLGSQRQRAIAGFGIQDHRSEEHTSELQSLMRISYAVFCLKKHKT